MGRRSPGGERVQNAAAAADSVMNIDDPVPSVAAAAHGAWRPQHDAHDETTRRAAQPNSRAVAPPPRRCRRCCCSCRYCRWPVKPPNEVGQWAAAPRHKCYPHTDDCMTVRARGGHSLCVIHERGQAFECSHSALAIPQCEPVEAMLRSRRRRCLATLCADRREKDTSSSFGGSASKHFWAPPRAYGA
jgi:hypothetical protein